MCPACGGSSCLSYRKVNGASLMECHCCAGFWLGSDVLEDLVNKASQGTPLGDFRVRSPESPANSEIVEQSGAMYRKCPVCPAMMNRVNYARRSGVIVDVCREHGVWFDADELSRILNWVRDGGKAEADRQRARDAEHQARLDAIEKQFQRQRDIARGAGPDRPGHPSPNILVILAEIAIDLLGWHRWRGL